MKKRVWLNTDTGKFSNSWPADLEKDFVDGCVNQIEDKPIKLIEYECLNDKEFEFKNYLRLA